MEFAVQLDPILGELRTPTHTPTPPGGWVGAGVTVTMMMCEEPLPLQPASNTTLIAASMPTRRATNRYRAPNVNPCISQFWERRRR